MAKVNLHIADTDSLARRQPYYTETHDLPRVPTNDDRLILRDRGGKLRMHFVQQVYLRAGQSDIAADCFVVRTMCAAGHAEILGIDNEASGFPVNDFLRTSDAEPNTVADFISKLLQFPLDYRVLPWPNDDGTKFRGFGFEINGGENLIISIEKPDGPIGMRDLER